jgi:hypothetical protein
MFNAKVWTIVLAQALVGVLPSIPLCCLGGSMPSGAARPAVCRGGCCEVPQPAPSTKCECTVKPTPAALQGDRDKTSAPQSDLVAWLVPPATFNVAAPRRTIGNASVKSDDVPDIPARILFCTWLE